jgi:hypothetical protein
MNIFLATLGDPILQIGGGIILLAALVLILALRSPAIHLSPWHQWLLTRIMLLVCFSLFLVEVRAWKITQIARCLGSWVPAGYPLHRARAGGLMPTSGEITRVGHFSSFYHMQRERTNSLLTVQACKSLQCAIRRCPFSMALASITNSVKRRNRMEDTALSIDDIDQLRLSRSDGISIIWVDISERPDLAALATRSTREAGDAVCTWFFGNPGKRNMIVGLRVALSPPTNTVFVLAFQVERFAGHLSIIAKYGKLWVVPGPPQAHLIGTQQMDAHTFLTQVVNYSGQGVLIELESHLVTALRTQFDEWKRLK